MTTGVKYEPRGKVASLIEAMEAQPERIWNSAEVAEKLQAQQGSVSAHLDPAIRHARIFRRLENGRCQYSIRPFPPPQFVPKPMVAPRPGSDLPHVSPPPAARETCAVCDDPAVCVASKDCREARRMRETMEAFAAPAKAAAGGVGSGGTSPGEPQPVGDPAPEQAVEVDAESEQFDFCHWRNGGMQVWGAQQHDDGSFTLTAGQLQEILRWVTGEEVTV